MLLRILVVLWGRSPKLKSMSGDCDLIGVNIGAKPRPIGGDFNFGLSTVSGLVAWLFVSMDSIPYCKLKLLD